MGVQTRINYSPISCTCSICKDMCNKASCIPTPAEAEILVNKYPERMVIYKDITNKPIKYIAPRMKDGHCTFLSNDGLCELHDIKLKPLEGRLAHHDRPVLKLRVFMLNIWKKYNLDGKKGTI